jgi:uncharacterized protein YbgA (DUF1722 family)/uncharacterized protein YbbK (DUF523 family)
MAQNSVSEATFKLRLGVSGCLLGEEVRYNGGHKHMHYLTHALGAYVDWVSVCPEVEMGMDTPRESIRLQGDVEDPQLVGPKSGTDHTVAMKTWAKSRLDDLALLDLHGYVLKKDSPSCGLFRVRVYNIKTGIPTREGQGIFARALMERMPFLPIEEEGRLNDLPLRENFIERMFAYYRLKQMIKENPTPGGLVAFHSGMKMSILAHSPEHYREMGQLVALGSKIAWDEMIGRYGQLMMTGLQVMSTQGKHVNVLMHLMGFVKDKMSGQDKTEILEVFESYRMRFLPLIVPITLLKHHLNRNEVPEWVLEQVYLNPYPAELMLRNHV